MQAHNLLMCDQPDPKNNFSPEKKIRNFSVAQLLVWYAVVRSGAAVSAVVLRRLFSLDDDLTVHPNCLLLSKTITFYKKNMRQIVSLACFSLRLLSNVHLGHCFHTIQVH